MPTKKKLPELLEDESELEAPQARVHVASKPAPLALYAYADFEVQGVQFKEGEKFSPPLGWQRAPQMDELLSASKVKQGSTAGIAFSYQGEIINPGEKEPSLRERRQHTAVLPLEER